MDFRILGPLEVEDEGRLIRLGGAKQRALLAVLLLRANEVVSRDRLIDELWGESPPETASTALQVHVSQLRKALGPDRIETRRPGYRLEVGSGELDLDRFEALLERAREQDPREAESGLREALGLWRGAPLADLDVALARPERARLEERRLTALEQRIEAELALGHGSELVAELERLVAEHPLRERPRGQLMIALYRSGRQADALEVYRRGRRLLSEELGLEPDESLQRLETAILTHDPSLDADTAPADAPDTRRHPVTILPDSVALIDAASQRVIGVIQVGRRPVSITVGHGSVWVANADDGTVSRIDPGRREVVRTIGIGAPAIDLAVGPDAVWVATGSDGRVSRIDPYADAVVDTIDLRGSSEFAWNPVYAVEVGEDAVWVAVGPRHVVRLDPATSGVVAIVDVGHIPVGVVVSQGSLWVATTAERALRIEPGTNGATIEVPIGLPVALAASEDDLWVSDVRGQIWRIDSNTAAVTQTTSVGRGLLGLCAGGGALWATLNADGSVARIDPLGGQVSGNVTVGHAPTDVAFSEDVLWVSIQSEGAI
jgi:DNA-binding SARP family transcriptional activator